MSSAQPPAASAVPAKPASLAASSVMFMASLSFGNVGYFASVFLLAHWFVPSDRAIVAFSTLAVLILSRFSRGGVADAASVFGAAEPERRSSLLANQLAFSFVSASVLGVCFVGALKLSGSHPAGIASGTMFVVLGGTVVYALYDTLGVFLVSSGHSKLYALTYPIEGWGWCAGIIAIRLFAHVIPGSVVACWVGAIAVGGLIRLTGAVRSTGLAQPSLEAIRRLVRFGFLPWVGGLCTFVSYRFDQVLMGFISTRTQLGLYAVAVNGSEVLLYVAMATSIALTPAIARSDPETMAARALQACRGVTVITLASTIVGLILGPFLLPFVFGHNYQGSVPSYLVLAGGAFGWTTSVVLSSALLGAKSSKASSVGAVAALLVGVILDIALIPPFGALGAAIATSAGFLAAGLASATAFRRRFGTTAREFIPSWTDVVWIAGFVGSILGNVRGRISRPAAADQSGG